MIELLSEEGLQQFYAARGTGILFLLIAGLLFLLGKAADVLVGKAVVLSERSGLPKVIIGATIVSLGTTSPEAAVSVLAALQGDPGLALGNAVGSIICDTGLILGIAVLIDPPLLPRAIVDRQGWIQLGAGAMLAAACWPRDGGNPMVTGGTLTQISGVGFLLLLGIYLWLSVKWARDASGNVAAEIAEIEQQTGDRAAPVGVVITKLLLSVGAVVLVSHVLIPAIKIAAERIGVPASIVAATLVAFGTSLPELVTAVAASRKGHGDLAVGNVIGADILNVLFVAGASAAVTSEGLHASPDFFRILFPAMLAVLIIFRIGAQLSGRRMQRPFGWVLLASYAVAMVLSYTVLAGH